VVFQQGFQAGPRLNAVGRRVAAHLGNALPDAPSQPRPALRLPGFAIRDAPGPAAGRRFLPRIVTHIIPKVAGSWPPSAGTTAGQAGMGMAGVLGVQERVVSATPALDRIPHSPALLAESMERH